MILGKSRTILPVELAGSIADHSRSVGLVKVKEGEEWCGIGTGFLVGKDLILTAAHVVGQDEQWPHRQYRVDFECVAKKAAGNHGPSFLDVAPYPWVDSAANELLSVLANAYPESGSRLEVLALAGIPRVQLLQEGTPHATWRQALEMAASMGRMRKLVEIVLEDKGVAGFHDQIQALLPAELPAEAHPIAVDFEAGWGAFRLSAPSSRAPLALGSAHGLEVGDGVIIVQHPWAGPKQFVLEPRGLVALTESRLHYAADTAPGSSGAPVFDSSMKVIAIHYSSGNRDATILHSSGAGYNIGVRVDLVKSGLVQRHLDFIERFD